MQTTRYLPLVLLAAAAGCGGGGPSPELVQARRTYDEARASQAATHAPDRLVAAKQALDRAEKAHDDDAQSFEERRLAYIAQRRAELAQAHADYMVAKQEEEAAKRAYVAKQDALRRQAEEAAAAQARELENARRQLSSVIADLKEAATVTEDARGMVITLSGSVLFATGKSELLPAAERRLESVAAALRNLGPNEKIVVEGHTDAQGDEDKNMELSEARANSVRDFLVRNGVDTSRIETVGRGETNPVAPNDTVDGRANNRRVEIIIAGGRSQGATPMPSPTESTPTESTPTESTPTQ